MSLKRCGRCVQALREPPRFVQPQPFLVLQRTHGRQRPKVLMEGRWTHMDVRCEVPRSGAGGCSDASATRWPARSDGSAARRRDLAQTRPLLAHQ